MGADVSHVTVLHRDPFVVVAALGWLQVSARHVEQGCDVKVAEIVLSGGMVGTTEVEERQDLYRFTLKGKGEGGEFMQVKTTLQIVQHSVISRPINKTKYWIPVFPVFFIHMV